MKVNFTNFKLVMIVFMLFFTNSIRAQYCTPSPGGGNNYIVNVETSDGMTNISRTSDNEYYFDATATHEVSQVQGATIDFEVNACGSSGSWCSYSYCKIWVDWNQDGDFDDADEEVYYFEPYPITTGAYDFLGTITVPLTATVGTTRMRIFTDWYQAPDYGYTAIAPCASTGWGEVEDYSFVVIAATPCDELVLTPGTLGDVEICPSTSFVIVNTGSTLGMGMDRVWQSSPAGSGIWTTIAGATSVNLAIPAGVLVATDYRCIVSCSASGASETTNVASVTLSSFLDCYCTPTYLYGCSSGATINSFSTLGAGVDISNLGTGCASGATGYSDYSATHSATAVQLTEITQTTAVTSYSGGVKVWIDYNQNGIFGDVADELVAASTGTIMAGSSFTSNFTVPLTALPGETRMRVRVVEGSSSFDPCSTYNYGEVEDYAFIVVPALPCDEVALVAGTLGSFEICPSVPFTLVNSGTSLGVGFVRTWQSSPAGSGVWTTIAGATLTNYTNTIGITANTDYRCIVSCPATGEVDTTNIAAITLSSFLDCYCTPTYLYGCSWGATINDFSTATAITNISNLGSGCASGALGYTNYSTDHSASAMQFQTISQTTGVTSYSGGVKIWIDYNQNGLFGDVADELVAASTGTVAAGTSFTSSFTIPLTAIPGETRMRVRVVEGSTTFDPCNIANYGETEDYTFIVVPAVSCADASITFPTAATSSASPANVCVSGDVTLSLTTTMPLATGITYQWESSPTATGPWTAIGAPSIFSTYFHTGVTANTYFRCNIRCEGTNQLYSSVILVQSVIPQLPEVFEGTSCGPGPVTLTGTIGSGDIFWFENPTGGMAFATGLEVESPSISTTTTFYASGGAYPPSQIAIGEDNNTTYYWDAGPFNQYYRRYTMQLMYTKAQLDAEGAIPGNFDAVSFYMTAAPLVPFPDYTVSIKTVSATSMTSLAWQTTGFTEVFGGIGTTYTPSTSSGWQQLDFTTPINWDGNSHIIVQVCWSQNTGYSWASGGTNWYSNTPGQMLFAGSNDAGTSCGLTGFSSSDYLPDAIFNFSGCVSERVPVIAYVRDTPVINIDVVDGEYCLFNNTFDIPTSPAQPVGSTFLWNTGDTDSFARVSTDGTPTVFWVEVTNEWGCTSSDSVHLTLKPSPEVDLGPDTLVCEGGVVTLDAGSGMASYYWNTGETTREIVIDDGGSYNVLVTNEFGCMATDEINVTIEGFAPTIDGIIVDNLSSNTFQFTPFHPMHILEYLWTFGDGTATSVSPNPIHTYSSPGTYMVTLEVSSTCGKKEYFTYATIVQSVDEFELSKNNLKLYPNPTNNILNIESVGGVKMSKLTIINMLGQEVLTQDLNKVESYQLDVNRFSNGAYHVVIESDKGKMTKKFQIVK